jgi:hypothetical protein
MNNIIDYIGIQPDTDFETNQLSEYDANITEKQQIIIKANLIENIKKWILLDTNMKIVNEKIKQIRIMKNEITEEICNCMLKQTNSTNLKNQNIKFNDGELRFYEKKEYSPLTFSYIKDCLENILEDESQIEFILDYLRDNREISTSIDIRRVARKKS